MKLAAEEVNKAGGVLGRSIEFVIEDDQSTNPGVVLAFSKLAGDKGIPVFIGPNRSTQIHAIAPDIQRLGKPVMIGGTDPQLTHMGNPWLFRFIPNDIYSADHLAMLVREDAKTATCSTLCTYEEEQSRCPKGEIILSFSMETMSR